MTVANVDLLHLTFLLGGARSGKSSLALKLAENAFACDRSPPQLIFIATAGPEDKEMAARIARHQAERGPRWRTVEAPLELFPALQEASSAGSVIVVDCLTLWLSNLMQAGRDPERAGTEMLNYAAQCSGRVILISNEIGQGIVPDNPLARAFRDHAGRLHQKIAAKADRVSFIVMGLFLPLK